MKQFTCASGLVMSVLACASTNVVAQEQPTRWGVGVATIIQQQGYVGVSSESMVVPIIYYQSPDFSLLGPTFAYKFARLDDVEFSLEGQVRFGGYDQEDGAIFAGMEDRSMTLDLGLGIEYETDFGDVSFKFMADALGEHQGNEISVGYSKTLRVDAAMVTPFITVSRQSADLVDYYYGVRNSEVTNFRSFYSADAATNVELGVRYNRQFGRHHSVLVNASYTMFGDAIEDSPLVEDSSETSLILGYMYVF